jgi:hypothetical protein
MAGQARSSSSSRALLIPFVPDALADETVWDDDESDPMD